MGIDSTRRDVTLRSGEKERLGPIFSTSRFGKPLIIYNGHRFNQHSSSRGLRGFYVCIKRSWGCRASIKTHDGEIIHMVTEHTHHERHDNQTGRTVNKEKIVVLEPKYVTCQGKLFQRVLRSNKAELVEITGDVPMFSKFGPGRRRFVKYKGYRYRQATHPRHDIARYVCNKWTSGCKAFIKANGDDVIEIQDVHSHS